MYKGTARAEQLYERTGSESTRGSAKGFTLLGEGVCPTSVLKDREKLEATRKAAHARMATIAGKIAAIKQQLSVARQQSPAFYDLVQQRNDLRNEYQKALKEIEAINQMLNLANPAPPPQAVPMAFVDVAREVLTKAQFDIIMKKARDRAGRDTNNKE